MSNTGEWQTIDSAPTDGSWVFLYWPTMSIHMYPAVGFSHGDEYGWELAQDRDYGEVIPTHWMGMPPSPTKEPSFPKPDTPLAQLLARLGSIREAAQGVVDWADFALANPKEFDSHGVKNLDGPAFDKLRAALATPANSRAEAIGAEATRLLDFIRDEGPCAKEWEAISDCADRLRALLQQEDE